MAVKVQRKQHVSSPHKMMSNLESQGRKGRVEELWVDSGAQAKIEAGWGCEV